MTKTDQRKLRIDTLRKIGVLTPQSSSKRDDDIEKYLQNKVEKDHKILTGLITRFKHTKPDEIVNFPVQFDH